MTNQREATQVVTLAQNGGDAHYLGALGKVSATKYSWSMPGGYLQLSCTLGREPSFRHPAMQPGRLVRAYRGTSTVWKGKLDEPQPSRTGGWSITAHGTGAAGADILCDPDPWTASVQFGAAATNNSGKVKKTYTTGVASTIKRIRKHRRKVIHTHVITTGHRSTLRHHTVLTLPQGVTVDVTGATLTGPVSGRLNPAIDYAIQRGLPWKNPGINLGWTTRTPPDHFSISMTDFMNHITQDAGLTWYVDENDYVQVIEVPDQVNRLMTTTDPVGRTITNYVNRLYAKFTSETKQAFVSNNDLFVYVDDEPSQDEHGVIEALIDLTTGSGMQAMSPEDARALALNVLSRYAAVTYSSPVTIRHGQLMMKGGQATDLGCEQPPIVSRLLVTDYGYGDETGPIEFPFGTYEYDDDAMTATVTPFQSDDASIPSLLATLVPATRSQV
jgi:hypothetical protein